MLRLLEITLTDKESVAIYDTYADETALLADFETKTGQAMKAKEYKAEYLLAFDESGKIYGQKYISKGEEYTLSPRLIWAQTKSGEKTADHSKKDDMNALEADFHIKKGSAMANANISQMFLMGFDGKELPYVFNWERPIEPTE